MPAPKEKIQPKTPSATPTSGATPKADEENVKQTQAPLQAQTPLQKPPSISSSAQASTETSNHPRTPSREEIELAAYALYLERGGLEGYAVDDWLQAERELIEGAEAQGKARAKSA